LTHAPGLGATHSGCDGVGDGSKEKLRETSSKGEEEFSAEANIKHSKKSGHTNNTFITAKPARQQTNQVGFEA